MRIDGLQTDAIPLECVALDADGHAVLGLSTLRVSISRDSDGKRFDFADGTFKASPTQGTAALTAVGATLHPGLYHLASGFTPPQDDTYSITFTDSAAHSTVTSLPETVTHVRGPLPKSAALGANLVDGFVPMVDSLRDSLYSAFGVRQFRTILTRTLWTGGMEGKGARRVTHRRELVPAPAVELKDTHDLTPGGLQEVGTATLSEVSLAYTEADLGYAPTLPGEAYRYLLLDAHGQGTHRRVYLPGEHPTAHRADTTDACGYTVELRRDDAYNAVGG